MVLKTVLLSSLLRTAQTIVARQTGDALWLINGTGLEVAGNNTVTGTVDGRDVAADGALAASAVQPGDLATVATTGAYGDLSGTPTLATVATSGLYSDLSGTPNLATVATSGLYSDLSGTPAYPHQHQ